MAMAGVLPASGTWVELHEPTGEDELALLRATGPAAPTMLALVARLASDQREPIDWPALPAVDLGAAALLMRSDWLGKLIRAEAMCPVAGCGEPIDVPISIPEYLHHHRARPARSASPCEPGWFALSGSEVRFRIPTIADLLARLDGGSEASLRERCVQPPGLTAAVARRVDRALDALAPRLDGDLSGTCPACGERVGLRFEPISYVLEELREASGGLLAQVHELAFAYHWSEADILRLDRRRRQGYVSMIRGEYALA